MNDNYFTERWWCAPNEPPEVREYIERVHKQEEQLSHPILTEYAGNFCYYMIGDKVTESKYNEVVKQMCCGFHTEQISGKVNGKDVQYIVSWDYGH